LLDLQRVRAFGRLLSGGTWRASGGSAAGGSKRAGFAELIVAAGEAVGRAEGAGNEINGDSESAIANAGSRDAGAGLTAQVAASGGTTATTTARAATGGSTTDRAKTAATWAAAAAAASRRRPDGGSRRLALVNRAAALLMLDRVEALHGIDDLNGRTDADAVDDAGDAAALLVAAFRPDVVVLILSSVDFAHAVAGTLPNRTALIRFGDLDRVGTARRGSDVRLGTHGDALDATVDAETALLATVVPPVSLDILDVLVNAGLGQVLTFIHGTAFTFRHVAHGDASVGSGWRERRRASLGAVDFSGATVASQFAAVVEDLLVLILLTFVSARGKLLADPDVAAALFVLDLLRMRALGRRRQFDERRAPADAVDLAAEGADAPRVASLKEGLALRDRTPVVVAEVDLVATLPVMAALALFAEVLRLRARVLRRHEAHHALGAAADFTGVTLAIPVAAVLERLAVLVSRALVHARSVDQPEVALPSVAAGGG